MCCFGSWSRPARSRTANSSLIARWSPSSPSSVRRSVSVLVRPSRIATVRWTCSETTGSWVTMTIVVPSSSLTRRRSAKTSVRRAAVELAGRLVGEEDLRGVGERDGDRDALLLAARQALGPVIEPIGQADEAEQLRRPLAATAAAVEDHRQLDVLDRAQVRQQVAGGLLPDEPDDPAPVARPLAAADLAELVAGDDRPAGRRDLEPAEDVHQRRLAAARRADDRDHLALVDEQVEALEGDDLEVGDLEDLDEVVAADEGALAVARPLRCRRARPGAGSRRWRSARPPPRPASGGRSSISGPASEAQRGRSLASFIRILVVRRPPGPHLAGAPRRGRCPGRR